MGYQRDRLSNQSTLVFLVPVDTDGDWIQFIDTDDDNDGWSDADGGIANLAMLGLHSLQDNQGLPTLTSLTITPQT